MCLLSYFDPAFIAKFYLDERKPVPEVRTPRTDSRSIGKGFACRQPRSHRGQASGGTGGERSVVLGLPELQVLEDTRDGRRIVNRREYAHRAVALRTFEWIGFVDRANQPRSGGPGPRGERAHELDGRCAHGRHILALVSFGPLTARAVRVPYQRLRARAQFLVGKFLVLARSLPIQARKEPALPSRKRFRGFAISSVYSAAPSQDFT